MTTIYITFINMSKEILCIASATFFLAAMQFAKTHLISVGWHKLASVSWNG